MRSSLWRAVRAAGLGALALVIIGCDEQPTVQVERIRAIKPYYIAEPAGGDVRRYNGKIAASNTSALSFSDSGTVATVNVKQGERVKAGRVLATLDPKPFKLDVRAAQSQLTSAQANYAEKKADREHKKKLFARGWVRSKRHLWR